MARLTTLTILLAGTISATAADFVVAVGGDDAAAGSAQQPFATVARAQQAVRELRAAQPQRATPITVEVQSGWYTLTEPLRFTPVDSGTAASPTIWRAGTGGDVVISGGRKLTGWTVADGRWTLQLPADQPLFSLLYVNSEPRYRPRLPKSGYYTIAEGLEPTEANQHRGGDRLGFEAGQIRSDWHNLSDVEVSVFNEWNTARLRIKSVDEANLAVTFTGPTANTEWWAMPIAGKRFVVDNVREALSEPGQWYLDTQSRLLTYLPREGETPANTTVVAPVLEQLLTITGELAIGRPVEHLTLDGLTFAHTNYYLPPAGRNFPQAEADLPAAVSATGVQDSRFQNTRVLHVAGYGLELGEGCRRNVVENSIFSDLGAGGVKIGTMGVPIDEELLAGWNTVRDCTISHGGRFHPAGIGLWIGQSPHNEIVHNDIFDFYYTGISVGWTWGYGNARCEGNHIADNRVRQIGQAVLSDMGGIYTLGKQTGTVIEHNLFEDINAATYGGWGIYFDEGTADIVARNNLVNRTKTGGFHQHYGQNNLFENNIVAFASVGQLQRTRPEEHHQFTIRHCLIYYDQGVAAHGNLSNPDQYTIDENLYWDASGEPVEPAGQTWAEWQAGGTDVHSIIADPLFVNPKQGDFRLQPGSPASRIGFVPFELGGWGSRDPSQAWALEPMAPAFPLPGPPEPPKPISIDFEGLTVGEKPPGFIVAEQRAVPAATCRISDESPASGTRCLKLTDAPGQEHIWDPHCFLRPMFDGPLVQEDFDLKLGPGAELTHEWRDESRAPYLVGAGLRIAADGQLFEGDRPLAKLPTGEWLHFRIIAQTGRHENSSWTLELTLPDGQIQRWTDLRGNPRFRQFTWLGWTSHATTATEIWIDNISVRPVP